MKKITISLIVALLLLTSTVLAVNLDNMKIEIPEEYYDLKTAIDNNDTKVAYYEALLKTTKEELKQQIETSNIVYLGKNTNLSKTLMISEAQSGVTKKIFHLHMATEEQIGELKEQLKEEATAQTMYIENMTVYEVNGIRWLESSIRSGTDAITQYYTIVNGKSITISLQSAYSNTKQGELKEIIDTVEFTNLEEKPADFTNFIIIAVTAVLVLIVVVLMVMAFSKKNNNKR